MPEINYEVEATKLVERFRPFVNEKVVDPYYERIEYMNCENEKLRNAIKCAIIACDFSMSGCVVGGAQWHGLYKIKECLLKM